MIANLAVAALWSLAGLELFMLANKAMRETDILRWGKLPRVPRRKITRALQRLINWLDNFQPSKGV